MILRGPKQGITRFQITKHSQQHGTQPKVLLPSHAVTAPLWTPFGSCACRLRGRHQRLGLCWAVQAGLIQHHQQAVHLMPGQATGKCSQRQGSKSEAFEHQRQLKPPCRPVDRLIQHQRGFSSSQHRFDTASLSLRSNELAGQWASTCPLNLRSSKHLFATGSSIDLVAVYCSTALPCTLVLEISAAASICLSSAPTACVTLYCSTALPCTAQLLYPVLLNCSALYCRQSRGTGTVRTPQGWWGRWPTTSREGRGRHPTCSSCCSG
jgi:hypothetical protein